MDCLTFHVVSQFMAEAFAFVSDNLDGESFHEYRVLHVHVLIATDSLLSHDKEYQSTATSND